MKYEDNIESYVFFDGKNIFISKTLEPTFKFLVGIFSDIENLLSNQNNPIRPVFISLFTSLDTIFCLLTIYENELTNEQKIIETTKNSFEQYLDHYIFSDNNTHYKNDKLYFKFINGKLFQKLRNSLVHFNSVYKNILLLPDSEINKANEITKDSRNDLIAFTPIVFYILIQDFTRQILEKWTFDSQNKTIEFNRKIGLVNKIVSKNGSKFVSFK